MSDRSNPGQPLVERPRKTTSAARDVVMKMLRNLPLFTAVSLLIGLVLVCIPPEATITAGTKAAQEAKLRHDWHMSMLKVPLPKKGTFEATYPKKEWKEVKYNLKPVRYPMVPRKGPRPLNVGNGNNVSAQAPTGTISTGIGSFDSVTGVTSESGQVGGAGPAVANAYSLQLNTNFFPSTVAGSPMGCQGWEQFVYQNDGGTSTNCLAYIQYWLINYGPTSPPGAGWIQYGSDWYRNSNNYSFVPNQPISNLAHLHLSGTVSATGDSYFFSTETTMYAGTGDNSVNAAAGWNMAEFCVVGDGALGQANFNSGAQIVTRTEIIYGGTDPPTCFAHGFTGETNNLSFGPTAPGKSPPGPAVIAEESYAGGASSACAAATSVGDTHLTTFDGLLYDFQASGDFVLAQVEPDFVVQSRQVSGAPTWPNASLNHAVATQMGKTKVAIGVGPKLVIDGKATDLGDGHSLYTADGVTVWRRSNVYFVTSQSGNSVRATVNASWIDVLVGLDQCCAKAKAKGLLANAKGNVNQLVARNGTVLTNPFSFKDLYSTYGDSWRVSPKDSLLSVFGNEKLVAANPRKLFHVRDLDPKLYERSRAVSKEAGVKEGALLDAATLDVAFFGNEKAARVFVGAPPPSPWGKSSATSDCSGMWGPAAARWPGLSMDAMARRTRDGHSLKRSTRIGR